MRPEWRHGRGQHGSGQGQRGPLGRAHVVLQEVRGKGQADQQNREREAAMHIGPDHGEARDHGQPPRMGPSGGQEPEGDREQGDREDLRPDVQIGQGQEESPQAQGDRRPHTGAQPAAGQVERADTGRHYEAPQGDDRWPPACLPGARECHLGEPLLVEPRPARSRKAVGVHAWDGLRGQDVESCTDVVGQVDRGCPRQHDHQGGQDERDQDPCSVQAARPGRGAEPPFGWTEAIGRIAHGRSCTFLNLASHAPMLRVLSGP